MERIPRVFSQFLGIIGRYYAFVEYWRTVNMKLGLLSAAAILTTGHLIQAQCPDFTTFSQVSDYFHIINAK